MKFGKEVGGGRRALCRGPGMEKVGHVPESRRSQSVARAPRRWRCMEQRRTVPAKPHANCRFVSKINYLIIFFRVVYHIALEPL